MLFQSHVIEVLKNGRSMMVKELMQAIESKGIRAPYNTVYFSLKQLENFNVVSKCVGVNGSACQIGYALKPNYEEGLEEQKSQVGRFQKGNRTRNKTKAKKLSERQKFKQVGEPARQQAWLNELLAKSRVNRIKRGLTV